MDARQSAPPSVRIPWLAFVLESRRGREEVIAHVAVLRSAAGSISPVEAYMAPRNRLGHLVVGMTMSSGVSVTLLEVVPSTGPLTNLALGPAWGLQENPDRGRTGNATMSIGSKALPGMARLKRTNFKGATPTRRQQGSGTVLMNSSMKAFAFRKTKRAP